MPFFDFQSHKLHFSDSGVRNGHVIVFIHGWTSSQRVFQKNIEYFGRKYRVIGIDLPGHGQSDRADATEFKNLYGHPYFADSVVALLSQLDVKNVSIIGWSLGGTVAIDLVLRYPDIVDNLILVSTPAIFFLPTDDDPFPGLPKSEV